MIRSFAGHKPVVAASAFVHDTAEVIGRVHLGASASVWPYAVLRGDVDAVRVGACSNIQDCAVVHCREGRPAVIGKGVTVGHGAIVHGARIADRCLIGMGAIVMEAHIAAECLIAAGALVLAGMRVAPRSLVMGNPARVVRTLRPGEIRSLRESEQSYVVLAGKHKRTSRVVF